MRRMWLRRLLLRATQRLDVHHRPVALETGQRGFAAAFVDVAALAGLQHDVAVVDLDRGPAVVFRHHHLVQLLARSNAHHVVRQARAEAFGDVSTARRAYKRALRLAPDDSATLCNYAEMLRGR